MDKTRTAAWTRGRASRVSCLPPGQHATHNAIPEDESVHQRTRNMRADENDQSGLEQHVSIAGSAST